MPDIERCRGNHATRRRVVRAIAAAPAATVVLLAVVGPTLAGRDAGLIVGRPYSGPANGLPLGTDFAGRNVWLRLLAGGRPLVLIPVLAVCLTAVVGTAMGMLAGYQGGLVDTIVSRLDSLFLAVPPILVLLVLLNGLGYTVVTLVAAVMITGEPFVSRIARSATLQVMQKGYVEQAVALGESTPAVLSGEILPNIVRPILADAGTRLAVAIALTATAGFLGFGTDGPNWGAMISQNVEGISLTPWGVVAPALCLATLAVSANLVMDRVAARLDH